MSILTDAPEDPPKPPHISKDTPTEQPAELTKEKLRRIQITPSNLETYLQRDSSVKRLSLGLPTQTEGMREWLRLWKEWWDLAGRT